MTSLLDVLKETDLRVGFTQAFKILASREVLPREVLQQRLLLCLYGLGTNAGLKRCSSSEVAAMIEGVLRHCTDLEVQRNYVDSHGQSHVAFAFSWASTWCPGSRTNVPGG